MTNTITFHLKRGFIFLSSLQNTYHNGLNFGSKRDTWTDKLVWIDKKMKKN